MQRECSGSILKKRVWYKMSENRKYLQLDPRAGLLILVLANVITLIRNDPVFQAVWIGVLALLYILGGQVIGGLKFLLAYIVLYAIEWFLLPMASKTVVTSFAIFINYARRMFPCLMIGWFMIRTISLREFVAALRALHIPQSVIIPISVTLRYFPAIREESGHIRDAMKLKQIRGFGKVEAFVVPFMMSAVNTAEELSAAAVTRGIENPVKKTGTIQLKLRGYDFLWMATGIGFTVAAIILR